MRIPRRERRYSTGFVGNCAEQSHSLGWRDPDERCATHRQEAGDRRERVRRLARNPSVGCQGRRRPCHVAQHELHQRYRGHCRRALLRRRFRRCGAARCNGRMRCRVPLRRRCADVVARSRAVVPHQLVMRYARERGLPAVALCISTTYGPGDWQPTPHGGLIAQLAAGREPAIFAISRSFVGLKLRILMQM